MELVISVCLLAQPADCRDERISLSMDLQAPMQCMIGAQPVIAEWSQTHPKWKVERWKCGPAGREGQRV